MFSRHSLVGSGHGCADFRDSSTADSALALSESDIDELVAFMASLRSADYKEQGLKELARQHELSRTKRPQRDTARAFAPKVQQPKPPQGLFGRPR